MNVPPHSAMIEQPSPQQQRVKVVAGYALQQRLGSGSFATVYKGVKVPTATLTAATTDAMEDNNNSTSSSPDVVAIKAITRTSEKLTKKVLANLELEISILRTYRHPNIVCMHTVQKTERHFYLLLEYCGGGDVQQLIRTRQKGRLSERLTRRLLRDLACGLRFLWGHELIHRDIKPQNLLLTGSLPLDEVNDREASPEAEARRQAANFPTADFCLKIADFGFARHLQTTSLAETLCGSPLYMAPEILQHHRYDAKADLWSVGTVLFEMIAGRPPFHGENHIDLLRNIQRKAVRLPPDVRVSKPCVTLLRLLLNRNPLRRAGFEEFFVACKDFVDLGCEGPTTATTTNTLGTRVPADLGTIPEDDGANNVAGGSRNNSDNSIDINYDTNNNPLNTTETPMTSDSFMTVASSASPTQTNQTQRQHVPPPYAAQPQRLGQAPNPPQQTRRMLIPNNNTSTAVMSSNQRFPTSQMIYPMVAATPSTPTNANYGTLATTNRLRPLEQSPPGSNASTPTPSSYLTTTPIVPSIPSLFTNTAQTTPTPWQEQQPSSSPTPQEVVQSQSASTDENGFVLVELGVQQQQQQSLHPSNSLVRAVTPGPPSSPRYYNFANKTSKGMLSTSPGTGGLLMNFVTGGRAASRIGYEPSPKQQNQQTMQQQQQQASLKFTTAKKLIATAEDVGRRAISVAHLGDARAYLAMRLLFLSTSSSLEDGGCDTDDSMEVFNEHQLARQHSKQMNATDSFCGRHRSSSLPMSNENMVSTELSTQQLHNQQQQQHSIEDDSEIDEMPFAISPDTPVALTTFSSAPTAASTEQAHNATTTPKTNASFAASASSKSNPDIIRTHFEEALSCYLKALKLLKSSVGAAQRVATDLDIASTASTTSMIATVIGNAVSNNNNHLASSESIPKLQHRCQVTLNWLSEQFRGVLERAEAATIEIQKVRPSTPVNPIPVEELIYNHALSSGRDGAVKQLLGQWDAARFSYRSAGLLAETLLMEPTIGPEDRAILTSYVDGFAARITELDQYRMMIQHEQQQQHPNPSSPSGTNSRVGVVGLIGPRPSIGTPSTTSTGILTGANPTNNNGGFFLRASPLPPVVSSVSSHMNAKR